MSYDHYHISILTENSEVKELVISEGEDYHSVVDWFCELGEKKVLARKKKLIEAIRFAVNTLKKKFKGKILRGAGCPPDKMLDEVEKDG